MKRTVRLGLYQLLVNRVPNIGEQYREMRKNYGGKKGRLLCWCALLFWNIRYYLLAGENSRFSGRMYEKKKLKLQESAHPGRIAKQELEKKIAASDVVSFDVFDTLIVRPFSDPTDLFYLIGMYFSCPDFRLFRIEAEQKARYKKKNGAEVTLGEIWYELENMTGIPAKEGILIEKEVEQKYCFANPYFVGLPEKIKEAGKKVIVISDMYLDQKFLLNLLVQQGFGMVDVCFVSAEYGGTKADGTLYEIVRRKMEEMEDRYSLRFLHIGDNRHSDIDMAKRAGWDTFWYPNVQEQGRRYRPRDMSVMTGSMYRGLVNIRLHSGNCTYSPFYEYGYIYGGILALGYCQFIHAFVKENKIDGVWFLARDGEILKKIYDRLYPDEETFYVLWSRGAAARLLSSVWKEDFFERFLFQKMGQGYSMKDIFKGMELEHLLLEACEILNCRGDTVLSNSLAVKCKEFLLKQWEKVECSYHEEKEAARIYLTDLVKGQKRIVVVDVGWAGSGAMGISYLLQEEFGLSCSVYGLLAGTNTCHNIRPDTAESFLFRKIIASYVFSQVKNRDLWKFHDLNQKHNLYVELLFTSVTPTLKGFGLDEKGNPYFRYGKKEAHREQILRIQKGILDFVEDYSKYFPAFLTGQTGRIEGRDAYAPLLLFLQDKKVRKSLECLFEWDMSENA